MAKTLLLADDSVTIQRVVELTFAHEDIRVVSIGDGPKAVQWIETERPDIVVADVGVPNLDGYAIVQHIKKSPALRHIPVLLLAGAFEPVDDVKARASGSDGVLVKPFEPKHLVARVKELLVESERWSPAGKTPAAVGAPAAAAVAPAPARPSPFVEAAARADDRPAPPAAAAVSAPSTPRIHQPEKREATMEPSAELEVDQTGGAPEPLEMPTSAIWGPGGSTSASPAPAPAAAPHAKVSLATAFSELLAAEQARPAQTGPTAPPQIPEAAIEEAVRRILARMTGEAVRQIVLDTAERLIREEIEKIKANPE
jgi:CheY-like chemotaxis protein